MIRFIRLGVVCTALSNYEIIARDEFRVPECKKQPIISPNFPPTNPAQFATKQMTNLIALEFTTYMYLQVVYRVSKYYLQHVIFNY